METEKHFNLVPSVGGSFSYGWRTMFGKPFLVLLLAVVITGLLRSPLSVNYQIDNGNWMDFVWVMPAAIFGLAYGFLLLPVITYGEKYMFLKGMRDEENPIPILGVNEA